MKTSKIKEVGNIKEFKNSFGTTIYQDLTMENGDKINIGKKALQKVGWELTYEIVDEQSGEFMKSKSVKPEGTFQAQSNPQSSSNGVNTQNLIVAQNSITNAVKFLEADLTAKPADVIQYAEDFYKWVMSKGGNNGN